MRKRSRDSGAAPLGRPKLAMARDAVLYLRLTGEERARIDAWAAKCNRTAPDWARLVLLRCVDAEIRE